MVSLLRVRLFFGRKRKFIFRLFLFYGRKSKIYFRSACNCMIIFHHIDRYYFLFHLTCVTCNYQIWPDNPLLGGIVCTRFSRFQTLTLPSPTSHSFALHQLQLCIYFSHVSDGVQCRRGGVVCWIRYNEEHDACDGRLYSSTAATQRPRRKC